MALGSGTALVSAVSCFFFDHWGSTKLNKVPIRNTPSRRAGYLIESGISSTCLRGYLLSPAAEFLLFSREHENQFTKSNDVYGFHFCMLCNYQFLRSL